MVSRRQLLKLSALGTASFAVPQAYSASKITMAYNTGNSIGSNSPKDLSDNARHLDLLVNGAKPSYPDRKGVPRRSWKGMEDSFSDSQSDRGERFQHFLLSSGYQSIGGYAPGLVVGERNQLFLKDGEYYRAAASLALPYTTTGIWADESSKFAPVGDAALRQELAGQNGSSMNGFIQMGADASQRNVQDKMRETVSVLDYGVITGYGADATNNVIRLDIAQAAAASLGVGLYWPDAVYAFDNGITERVHWHGNFAPTMGTFPTTQDDKAYFRPGMKDKTPGCVLVFKGTGTNTATINRGGTEITATYCVLSQRQTEDSTIGASSRICGMAIVLDFDLYDAEGVITQPYNDNRANYQVGHIIDNGGRSFFDDRVVFGYFSLAGTVITGRDPDRIRFNGGSSSGDTGTAVWGNGTNGLSSSQFNGYEFFANDHHSRNKVAAQWGRCALEIDGPIGASHSINGLYVNGGATNTYCNTPVIFGACDNVKFSDHTFELPDYEDSPGAETSRFIATSRTGDVYFDGSRFTDNPIYGVDRLSGQMGGALIVVGGPVVKAFDVTKAGRVARLRSDGVYASVQLGKDVASSTSGWVTRLNPNLADEYQLIFDNVAKASLATDGKFSATGGLVAKSSRSTPAAPGIMLHASDPQSGLYSISASLYGVSLSGVAHTQFDTAALFPGTDAALNVGKASFRYNNSFFAVAPTVTSDARMKEVRGELTDKEIAAWSSVRAKVFQMTDMVEAKGKDARFHVGYIAQEVQEAFLSAGLAPSRYALWCEDTDYKIVTEVRRGRRQKMEKVEEINDVIVVRDGVPVMLKQTHIVERPLTELAEVVDESGVVILNEQGSPMTAGVPVLEDFEELVQTQVENGTRLGLRYEQCLVLEAAYLRTIISSMQADIEKLKAR